ncbi:aminoacyl-tRNA hydrolase [Phycicoccus sp. BSK3Z-2]|uniref:Peptidyl-tRNA hydrolase n=1 Tax=Phycicoccus avicenniae TaxID=2828860 RepID=A0A941D8Y9_9MICO|nr:aminoacyl-tRNA hydrolase [Phycicoccus avicenniae]MBR7743696.1 aminoacyl-tRNA hydrolase [Phycicoccus avicenniae]
MIDSAPWLVVGLGNPGPGYAGNRHNVGAMVVDELARRTGSSLRTHKARAHAAQVRLGVGPGGVPGPAAVVAVPSSYMNESGGPVKALLSFFSVPVERLVVLHDEIDIDPGLVRLKLGGGEGGHNGLRSITSALGTRDYHRVRIGVGRPPGRMQAADFVLKDFSPTERKEMLPFLVDDAADAVEQLVTVGLLDAQRRVHAPR